MVVYDKLLAIADKRGRTGRVLVMIAQLYEVGLKTLQVWQKEHMYRLG